MGNSLHHRKVAIGISRRLAMWSMEGDAVMDEILRTYMMSSNTRGNSDTQPETSLRASASQQAIPHYTSTLTSNLSNNSYLYFSLRSASFLPSFPSSFHSLNYKQPVFEQCQIHHHHGPSRARCVTASQPSSRNPLLPRRHLHHLHRARSQAA